MKIERRWIDLDRKGTKIPRLNVEIVLAIFSASIDRYVQEENPSTCGRSFCCTACLEASPSGKCLPRRHRLAAQYQFK